MIGAGKSTLAKSLADKLGLPVYYEPVADNEYLQDFYTDIKKYSFAMQVYLLNRRFQQQQQIVWAGAGGVQDRTIYEDSVFARMLRNAGLMVNISRTFNELLILYPYRILCLYMVCTLKNNHSRLHLSPTPPYRYVFKNRMSVISKLTCPSSITCPTS